MKKKKLLGINFLCGAVSILAFLVLWNIAVQGELGKMLPGPIPVLEKFFTSLVSGKIGVMAGYALGSVVGVILGLAMGTYKMVEAICSPLFRIIRPIPPIAWIPISIIWIGLGEDAKIFLIFLASFCYVTLNAWNGVKNVDQQLVGAARMLGARDHQIFITIILPACVPSIFAGLQVALSSSWATVLAAEMVRSSNGLGWVIIAGMNNNDMLQILVGIVAIGIVGLVLSIIFRKVEAVLCRWNKSGT